MPFLPTFSDLKNATLSINPLNLFNDSKFNDSDHLTTVDDGFGKAGPGPSSLANRTRPSLKSDTSSSDSFEGHERRKSCGVMIQEDARPKRERKKKVQMDSYIIVKPPPTTSKNPLNLQIQMVMGKSGRPRSDSTATNNTGSRAPSLFSDPPSARTPASSGPGTPPLAASTRSIPPTTFPGETPSDGLDSPHSSEDAFAPPSRATTSSSSGPALRQITSRKSSTGSIPLSLTSGGGQKRIQPMFNLNVQSVMHSSVVTDAGTDAKVAKFGKRQLDIHDIGILEPTEIWQVPANSSALFPPTSALEETKSRPMSMYSLTAPISPTVTRVAEDGSRIRTSLDLLRPEILQEGGAGAKRFFGKIGGAFKKKADKDGASQTSSTLGPSPNPNNGAFPSTVGLARGVSRDGTVHLPQSVAVGPPTFGCSPNVIARRSSLPKLSSLSVEGLAPPDSASSARPPSNRPVAYAWTVRKWAQRNTEGWAAHLVEAVTQGVTMQGSLSSEGDNEVIFEWAKSRPSPTITPRSRRSSIASRSQSRPPYSSPRTEEAHAPVILGPAVATPTTPGLSPRPAPIRRSSATSLSPSKTDTNILPDDCSAVYHTAEEDDSDPEDSETPWTCTLIVKRTGETLVIGTLTPAPHHPKVVGQLRLPNKLETLCLANLAGSEEDVSRVQKEVCLSDAAVKDVVCVTALWLVAREGWNGLGKVKRGR